jgi:geranylgeranyl diphosphate synthase type II
MVVLNKLNETIEYYIKLIESIDYHGNPDELYQPINYILQLGGKRLRPVLVGMAAELFNGKKQQVDAIAKAIEIFHNFSLVHDDIMDRAPLRRGKKTVHEKWNSNIAILSGDVMLVKSYEELIKGNYSNLAAIIQVFNQTAIEVCEGQQLDMNFETRSSVSLDEYIEMIKLKTSVLLGGAVKMGALAVGAKEDEAQKIYQFGVNMGIAFQLMDDYLDAFGDPEKFGKQVGGDILSNKKTYLNILAIEKDNTGEAKKWLSSTNFEDKEKINSMLNIYQEYKIDEACRSKMNYFYELALQNLNEINVTDDKKQVFIQFAQWLMNRSN